MFQSVKDIVHGCLQLTPVYMFESIKLTVSMVVLNN